MNKNFFYLLLVVVLIIYLIFVKSDNRQAIKEQSSQEVKTMVAHKLNQDKSPPVSKIQKDHRTVEDEKRTKNKNILLQNTDMSYLTAFRHFTDFLLCKNVINDWQNNTLLKSFRQRLKDVRKFGFDGGKKHEEYYLAHFEHCKNYLLDDEETFTHAFNRLQKTYQNIDPETEQEKQLAEIVVGLDELGDLTPQLKILRKGVSSLTTLEIRNIDKKILRLSDLINPLLKIPEHKRTAEQTIIVNENYERIVGLRQILHESYIKDEDLLTNLGMSFSELRESLLQKLPHIKSPDIFALMLMWHDQNYLTDQLRPVFDKLKTDIRPNLRFKKDNYPIHLAQASLPLFACALDYPCGSDSQIMTYYCVIRPNYNACGKSVEEFILNDYISPNIKNDVNDFLTLLLDNYAQE